MSKKRMSVLFCILAPVLSLILSTYLNLEKIPNIMFMRENSTLKTGYLIKYNNQQETAMVDSKKDKSKDKIVNLKLLGIIPLKTINLKTVPDMVLYPGGVSVGVKLNTKGVLVVALSDIDGETNKISSPAAQSGIIIGDSILNINGIEIKSSEMLVKEINNNVRSNIEIILERKGAKITKNIKPVKSFPDGRYKIGLWVRDSTAGVGTLTFYDKDSKRFAALGHPVTDVDTGTILNIEKGEIISSSIVSIRKGVKGNPGELRGIFVDEDVVLGRVTKNTECGIFGEANDEIIGKCISKPMKIALRDEIKEGRAQIITSLDENGPKLYDIVIEKLLVQDTPGPKSMIIKVIDPILLEKTGGIVQGMSGSPIIQNNKLVGAVTHVLINKPDTGYGIYIEWMLKDSDIIAR